MEVAGQGGLPYTHLESWNLGDQGRGIALSIESRILTNRTNHLEFKVQDQLGIPEWDLVLKNKNKPNQT